MRKLDDKSTDDLFKVGAERHDFAYNPAAWERMEGLLAADRRRRLRRWLVIGLLALVVTTGVGYLVFSGNRETTPVAAAPTPVAKAPAADEASFGRRRAGVVRGDIPHSVGTGADDEQPSEVAGGRPAVSEIPAATAETTSRSTAFPRATATIPAPTDGATTDASPLKTNPSLAEVMPPVADRVTKVIDPLPARALAVVKSGAANDGAVGLPKPKASAPSQPVRRGGFALGLSAGTILGAVGATDPAELRPRFGATLEYRLAGGRLALGAGAYYNRVCYAATGEQYTSKTPGFWVDGIKPTTVEARCEVIELPVFATFYPRGARASGPFYRGGLTSYLMLHEDMAFDYPETRPDQIMSWQERGTNNHLLGLGQLSVGYQRMLGGRSALQLEGFVQAPLTGIGQGGVRLWTVGAAVNYQFGW